MLKELSFSTTKKEQFLDITSSIKDTVKKSKIQQGICFIYVPHATAGITINENADPNVSSDILKALSQMVPEGDEWKHDRIDNNATAHIKSTIVGVSMHIPIKDGELMLGKWQNVFLCEFDGPRERKVIIKIIENKD